jgi:hypothetical protein
VTNNEHLHPVSFAEASNSHAHGDLSLDEYVLVVEYLIEHPPEASVGLPSAGEAPVRLKVRGRKRQVVGYVFQIDRRWTYRAVAWTPEKREHSRRFPSRARAVAGLLGDLGWMTRLRSYDNCPTILTPYPTFVPPIERSKPRGCARLDSTPPGLPQPVYPGRRSGQCWGLVKLYDGTVLDCTLDEGHRPQGCEHDGDDGVSRSIDPETSTP